MSSGGRPTVAADVALGHVKTLVAACPGATPTYIARLAGVPSAVISRACRGARIEPDTEERLLAVREEHMRLLPPPMLPSTEVARHVEHLIAETGLTYKAVATAARVSHQTIYNIAGGGSRPQRTVTFAIHAAIMAITPDDVRGIGYWTDRRPSKTRVRALQANGWPFERLSASYGMNVGNVANAPDDSPIQTGVARRIEDMYRIIGDTPGGSLRAANTARAHGYRTPIHYDEDMNLIEVVEATDDEERQERARTRLCILALSVEHRQIADIVRTLGCTNGQVSSTRRKYGLRTDRSIDGGYVCAERWPGAFAAIRAATRHVHYRSTLDVLDGPDVDYVALLDTLREERQAAAA